MTSVPCQLIVDPPLSGAWNMAVDEALLETAVSEGIATLRLYQWAKPTLSLGYFQRYDDRHQHAASRDSAIVRRQSGGGAILHDRELTYSLVLPASHPLARQNQRLYTIVHQTIIDLLTPAIMGGWGNASVHRENSGALPQPPGEQSLAPWQFELNRIESKLSAMEEPFLCFQRRAVGDVVLIPQSDKLSTKGPLPQSGNWKILGSAQRRHRGAILQHGSLLLHRSPAAPELPGLADLLGAVIDPADIAAHLPDSLGAALYLSLHNMKLSNEMRQSAAVIEGSKYGHPTWTNRR